MIRLTGEINIFPEAHKSEKGNFNTFQTSIENDDPNNPGSKVRAYFEVRFSKEQFPKERLDAMGEGFYYTIELIDAWLMVRAYKAKDGTDGKAVYIYIKDGKPTKKTPLKAKRLKEDNELPF